MAGDWIKAEKSTPRKPEILRIAAKLGIHQDHAFGLCFRFWAWCDDNLGNGNAIGVTSVMLDALLERDGVASALIEVGWLQVRNGSLVVPNYDRHLSENAKKRALSSERTAKSRSRKCNAENVTEPLPEKRREEKSITNKETTRETEKAISPFPKNVEFSEAATQYIKTRTAKHGPPAESTIEAWWYDLSRFPVDEAIAILRLSTSAEAKKPITNGDHVKRATNSRKFDGGKQAVSDDQIFANIKEGSI